MESHYKDLKVYPKNWETSVKSNKKDWEIRYLYISSDRIEHLMRFKGMNHIKVHKERVEFTKNLLEQEKNLLNIGYNPITKSIESLENSVNHQTPFIEAFRLAMKKLSVVEATLKDIENTIMNVTKGAKAYGWEYTPIAEIGKREIKLILNWLTKNRRSNYKVNKVRANLSSLFKYFVEIDIFAVNFIHGISKLKHTVKEREIIRTDDEREAFGKLKEINYNLWRFATVFYYSGCRLEEILRPKVEDINI